MTATQTMNIRVFKILINLLKVYNLILYSNDTDFKLVQVSILLNHIIEICKAFYIENFDPSFERELCSYRDTVTKGKVYNEGTGILEDRTFSRSPRQIDTLVFTFEYYHAFDNTDSILRENFISDIIKARNSCVHDVFKHFLKVLDSVDVVKEYNNFLNRMLRGIFADHNIDYTIDFELLCKIIDECLQNTLVYSSNSVLHNDFLTSNEVEEAVQNLYPKPNTDTLASYEQESKSTTEQESFVDTNTNISGEIDKASEPEETVSDMEYDSVSDTEESEQDLFNLSNTNITDALDF